ncbi:MAG: hypothetical protein M3452_02785, partial [Chloroflexota bacterium]|nr:hypothetical protein [Chloroflexota bacterium]
MSESAEAVAGRPPGRGEGLTLYTRVVASLARFLVSSLGRVRVVNGMDRPPQGPLIIVANHISIM